MSFDRTLGKRCKYANDCALFNGTGIPEHMTLSLWRNVFCNRGIKGWSNCNKFQLFEKENPKNGIIASNSYMKTVFLHDIDDPTERAVLDLLKTKGPCLYGDIFKQLSISSNEGQQCILKLLSDGLIRFQYRSSIAELNIELK